jgi:hypothetical protein
LSFYVDTSLLVAAVAAEPGTRAAQDWLTVHAEDDCCISDWVVAEVSSALALKLRVGDLDRPRRAAALAAFTHLATDVLPVLPIGPVHFRLAASFCDREDLGLRAPDALHLAIAADHGATLVTADRRFREAALTLGVAAEGLG